MGSSLLMNNISLSNAHKDPNFQALPIRGIAYLRAATGMTWSGKQRPFSILKFRARIGILRLQKKNV